jgi:hypothetical protein
MYIATRVIGTNGRSLGTFPKAMFFPRWGTIEKKNMFVGLQMFGDFPKNVVQGTDLHGVCCAVAAL